MKILHLLYESKGDSFGIGGVGIRAYEIYKHLSSRHNITLLCKKYPGARDKEIEGLKHVFVGAETGNLTRALLSYAFSAAQFVREHGNEFDIIIEEFSPAIPTFLHAFTKKPLILQIQGYTGLLYFRKYNPFYAFTLYIMERLRPLFYKNFIFITPQTIKKLLPGNPPPSPFAKGGLNSPLPLREWDRVRGRRIEVIPNGISPELQSVISEESDYILYLGRIDIYGKGLGVLVNAYAEFLKSFPHIRLVIAGDGRDMERFETMLMKLPENARKNIELLGWVSGDKKTEVIRKALFCVFPSRHEVQPITSLEAMACGKALIVSEIPEFNFVKENSAGMSFKTGDALSMTQSMKDLMSSDERKEMGQRGRAWVKTYSWDKIALKYEDFLNSVLKEVQKK
jgi:glycosyltransferase involved in cell wall biosynthesis